MDKTRVTTHSDQTIQRAKGFIPGGVNSPARSFRSVGGRPFVVARGSGAYLEDVDGNRYIDLIGSWGALIHGHAHPRVESAIRATLERGTSFGVTSKPEIELCELMTSQVKGLEMVRLVNSGTEACMSAIRVARGATKRNAIVKFEGCYHGHGDSFLVAAGSGLATLSIADSAGVTEGTIKDTLVLPFNNIEELEKLFNLHGSSIAAVILEVVVGNSGVIAPDPNFLKRLRELTVQYGTVMIFDEVMTGFRLSFQGTQGIYGVQPDLMTYGKIIGGGLPVGAYGGRRDLMEQVTPLGPVYQAGTLSGNPLSASAGLASLQMIAEDEQHFYKRLDMATQAWASAMEVEIKSKGYGASISRSGSMFTLFFRPSPPKNFGEAIECDIDRFREFFWAALDAGVYFPPSQYEAAFFSVKHCEPDVLDETIEKSILALRRAYT